MLWSNFTGCDGLVVVGLNEFLAVRRLVEQRTGMVSRWAGPATGLSEKSNLPDTD
jgi:hypothetical protein